MKVIIIDDDALVLSSLRSIMQFNQIEVLGEASDGSGMLELYRETLPDVVLTDIRMKVMDGISAARELLQAFPEAKILLLTTFEDEEYISQALRLGCKGYILKHNISHLVPALLAANAGSMVFDSEIISKIASDNTKKAAAPQITALSEREYDIIKAVADGKNNKEIASELYLSEGTVRNYISDLLGKLELRDRTQLAIYYYKCLLNNSSAGN